MSMLRSFKFLKHFVSFSKNISTSGPRDISGTLLSRNLKISNYQSRFANQSAPRSRNYDKFVQKLDQEVRRNGRISRRDLDDIIKGMRRTREISSIQSLMVIRCCGNLIPEENPERRTELVNDIMKTFDSIGVSLDISHYNALLKVYLENEYNFSPSEFLTELQNKGIEPNRVTFQRLISVYCQRGDIEGATNILEYMKEKQMPVNESVFSSLINGHFQAGDEKSANEILDMMKQAKIPVTEETYTVLMCGYAKEGNAEEIINILAKCEAEDMVIQDKDILEVIYTLAINHHTDLIKKVAEHVKPTPVYNQDAKNVIFRLIARGEDEGALKVLRTMTRVTTSDGILPTGKFLIKQMVYSNCPFESIVKLCKELKETGENEHGLIIAAETSFAIKNPELSSKLLSALKDEHEVCQHYYWPILVEYGKRGDMKGLLDTLGQLVKEVGEPVNGETLREYVAPYVPGGEAGILLLRKAGIPLATSATAMVGYYVNKNNMQSAAQVALQFRSKYFSVYLAKLLASKFAVSQDLESYMTIVRAIAEQEKDSFDNTFHTDRVLLETASALKKSENETLLVKVLQAFLGVGLRVGDNVAEELENILKGDLTEEISTLLTKLTSPDLVYEPLKRLEYTRNSVDKDERFLFRLLNAATAKGEPAFGLKRQLLNLYCIERRLEKAENLKKELEEGGFVLLAGSQILFMDLYVHFENLPEALKYYENVVKNNESVQIDPVKLLRLGILMIKNGMIQEAIDLFVNRSIIEFDDEEEGIASSVIGWRFLNSLAELQDVENLNKAFDILLEKKIISPTNIMLGPLIKVHLLRDDTKSAVEVFEECCNKYRATPWKNELSCKLIENEDPISLQKLTDLSTEIHGEINSLYDLFVSFIQCGRIKQARKILETPGLRTKNHRIKVACERYCRDGNVEFLQNLIEVTKDFNHIDRSNIYYHLLQLYCKDDEVDKALGIWTQMQEDDVQPTNEFLIALGGLLKKHEMAVPFSIPETNIEVNNTSAPQAFPIQAEIRQFRQALRSNNVEEAIHVMESSDHVKFPNGDRSQLIYALLSNGRVGEAGKFVISWLEKGTAINAKPLKELMNVLAKAGDVDTLEAIGKYIDEDLKRATSFTNRLTHCMKEAGRSDEVLSNLREALQSAQTEDDLEKLAQEFPRGGIHSILEDPAMVEKFNEVAKEFRDKGILSPTNALWLHYFMDDNSEKANEQWFHLKNSGMLMVAPALYKLRTKMDSERTRNLLNIVKTSKVPPSTVGSIYSVLIDIENRRGDIDEGSAILEEALKDCTITDLSRTTLLRLKSKCELGGRPFKYLIPKYTKAVSKSSSSSDSDNESNNTQKATVR